MLVELCQFDGQSELPRWLASRGKIFKIWASRCPKNAFVSSLVLLTVLNRVSTRPGNPGNDLEFFSVLKFVLEFTISVFCLENVLIFFFVQSTKFFCFCILPLAIYLVFSNFVYSDHTPCYHFFLFFRK